MSATSNWLVIYILAWEAQSHPLAQFWGQEPPPPGSATCAEACKAIEQVEGKQKNRYQPVIDFLSTMYPPESSTCQLRTPAKVSSQAS